MRILYLDMDGVLCNFNQRCIELIGCTLDQFTDSQTGWNTLREKDPNGLIYSQLDPMPDADDLVNGCLTMATEGNYSVAVLTAIPKMSRIPLAKIHKREWLAKHYPILLQDFNIGPNAVHKQFHANIGDILIDDSVKNIPQWNDRGGYGILHINAEDSLNKLKSYVLI